MRRQAFIALAAFSAAMTFVSAMPTHAQRQGDQSGQEEDDAKKRKRDEEWGSNAPALPQLRNAGPCPYVKVLYDAARYVEFKDSREASAAVGYTGEIQGVAAACAYKDAQPIKVQMQVLFSMGRGPQATGSRHIYRYWVAVTHRNQGVIAKEYFDLPVTFPSGHDRINVTETLGNITIPRNDIKVSGANFEVLVGFDVTPEMAAFNRDGKRFRANAGQPSASGPSRQP